MNFLLHMLSRTHTQDALVGRRTPRFALLAQAAGHAAEGRLREALNAYRRLRSVDRLTPHDLLIRGHLHLVLNHPTSAHRDFSMGLERLLAPVEEAVPTSIEQTLSEADDFLRRGRYARAADVLAQARTLLDTLLAAQAGLYLAEAGRGSRLVTPTTSALVPLARLSDIALRLLARTHLATHLANSLRERHLRDDLAPWATSAQSVDTLLDSEFARLSAATAENPRHAENHYRLGLVARATHRLEEAAGAFSRTLQLHPHHIPSAARLAATLLQMERSGDRVVPMLDRAFRMPIATLQLFGTFARAAGRTAQFDRAAERLFAEHPDPTTARANLAFALSELALLDESHATWREPAAA